MKDRLFVNMSGNDHSIQRVAPMAAKSILEELELEHGLSLSEIASKVGVTRVSVWNWRRGRSTPRPHSQVRLARLLEVQRAGVTSEEISSFSEVVNEAKALVADALSLPPDAVTITISR